MDNSYPNARDCHHGRMRGSCELCDYEQDISELNDKVKSLLAIVDECRPKVISAQMRAHEHFEKTGEDGDYSDFISQLIDRIDAALEYKRGEDGITK